MKIILSPAKRLNEKFEGNLGIGTELNFLSHSQRLMKILKKLKKSEISELMKLSDALTDLNYSRFKLWKKSDVFEKGKPCVFLFEGDAYRGLDIESFSEVELQSLNDKLYILSGLYGILKPFDKVLPYRLEMGTKLENPKGKNLYDFWKSDLTKYLKKELKGELLINLASKEYASAIDFSKLKSTVVQVDFLQEKDGVYKNIAIFAKRARGLMTAFIAKNNPVNIEELKTFDAEDYFYNSHLSKENHLVFTR